jgi:ribonuclease VapC
LIVVDTSALCAILKDEPESEIFRKIVADQPSLVGTPTKFEYLMVASGQAHAPGRIAAEALLDDLGVEIVAWSDDHASIAADAFLNFGKGQHKASLNYGDCMAYALAKSLDLPLLFKGNDFSQTDIKPAL